MIKKEENVAMLACACVQDELRLTDLFAEEVSSIEFKEFIFFTDR